MNRHNRRIRVTVLWLADMIVSVLIYLLARRLRGTSLQLADHRTILAMIMMISTIISLLLKLNENFMGRSRLDEFLSVLKYNVIMIVSLIILMFAGHISDSLSRLAAAYFFFLNIVAMTVERFVIKRIAYRMFNSSGNKRKLIIIADEASYDDVRENFNPAYTFDIVGWFRASQLFTNGKVKDDTITAETMDISSALVTNEFDDVFIYAPTLPKAQVNGLVQHFATMGVRTHLGVDVPSYMGQNASFSDIGMNYSSINYSEKVFSPGDLAVKRLFDILGGIIGMVFTAIIFIFLAPAIKLDSPGPVIFSQTRVGRNGKRFKFYKFRSMYIDAEERKKDLMKQNQVNGLMFKMDDDPRITKVGKFIRKTSLDEFPQFWNVLKGDMSLVGTRPPTEDEFQHYNEYYRKRLSIKPGITGLWQVSGRSDIKDFDEVVKLDIKYIDNWSITEDFRILLKTIAVVFKHKGAE